MTDIRLATRDDFPSLLDVLRRDAGRHALAIQDLTVWPDLSRFYFDAPSFTRGIAGYLLHTGHPGSQRVKSLILEGTPDVATALFAHVPAGKWVMRETPGSLRAVIAAAAPEAVIYDEWRMDVDRSSFRPAKVLGRTRPLGPEDAPAIAAFYGLPTDKAAIFIRWLTHATLLGVFDGDRLAAFASTFVKTPEVWELVSITTHKDYRRRGLAAEVTSVITSLGLEAAPLVSLTVLQDNAPALGLYGKLGYRRREHRLWIDNGTGSSPNAG